MLKQPDKQELTSFEARYRTPGDLELTFFGKAAVVRQRR